jgi:hypothetical protein
MVKRENWRQAVFGYTCFINVTGAAKAAALGRQVSR